MEGWRAITFYQLGACLFDMVTGRRIFDEFSEPPARLYEAVRDHEPIVDVADAPAWLIHLARRCLTKDWRLRGEIVKWEDFDGPPAQASVEVILDRLRKRIGRTPTLGSRCGLCVT